MTALEAKDVNQQLQQARNELKNIRQQQHRLKADFCLEIGLIKQQLTSLCKNNSEGKTIDGSHSTQSKELIPRSNVAESTVNQREVQKPVSTLPSLKVIGWIHSMYTYKNGTPRQANVCEAGGAYLSINKELFSNPAHSLEGLEQFSHVWLLFAFHKNNNSYSSAKVRPPRMDGVRVGLFSTRSPYRPNPIGLSLACVERIQDDRIYFRGGIDLLDGTPVLDVKPYIPQYDSPNCSESCKTSRDTSNPCKIQSETDAIDRSDGQKISLVTEGGSTDRHLSHQTSASQSEHGNMSKTLQGTVDASIQQEETNISNQSVDCNESFSSIFSPNQDITSPHSTDVSVADWITCPTVPHLTVHFTSRASEQMKRFNRDASDPLYRLEHLKDSEDLRVAVRAILGADPRSVYRRKQCSDRLYYFIVDIVRVTCWFDDNELDRTIVEVLGAHTVATWT